MDLSIIIVYYNNDDFPNVLDSISNYPPSCNYEIIVVNNNSKRWDKSWEKKYDYVRFIHLPINVGFSKGNNIASKIAKGNRFLFLNPDTLVTKGAIDNLIKCKEKYNATVVGPKLIYPDGSLQYSCRDFINLFNVFFGRRSLIRKLFPNNPISRKFLKTDIDYTDPTFVDWMMGAALLIDKKDFFDIGMFDERFFLFLEDTDLQYRVYKRGGKTLYCPNAIIIHSHGTSMKKMFFYARFYHHISIYKYFMKYYNFKLLGEYFLIIGGILHLLIDVSISFRRWFKI